MELSEQDARRVRELAHAGAWWTYDVLVRDLVARGVQPEAIAQARKVPVALINEVLEDDAE